MALRGHFSFDRVDWICEGKDMKRQILLLAGSAALILIVILTWAMIANSL